jgi:geranylgeranylglycerol-phosphate geranylgeranyltransferase
MPPKLLETGETTARKEISTTSHKQRIRQVLRLARSRFARASVYTWATLMAVVLSTAGIPDPSTALLASLSTFLISLAVYVLNDLADLEVDKINAPNRPLVQGSINGSDALGMILLLNSGGLAIGYLFGIQTFLISMGEIGLGIAYSIKPFVLMNRALAKTLAIGVGGMMAILFGGAAAGNINGTVIYCAILFLAFLFTTSPINDLADYVGDLAQGRRTIPIRIGRRNTVRLALLASIAPMASAPLALPLLGLNSMTTILFGLLAARSIQILAPLLRENTNHQSVRILHKRLVPLHFLLQLSLVIGTLPILT